MQFSEFKAGAVFHAGPRHVDEPEIIEFARRYDPQPFHVDRELAARTRWRGLIASGWMTCGIAMELAVRHVLDGSGSIGSPGLDEIRWENPVRPGDALSLTVTVLESRLSSSGTTGVLRWRWELHNQAGLRVLSLLATSLFEVAAPR
ncbi:MAG: MaoC family dehydratase [Proteobacteria bacterium]|nr:MaoC family dehydratase [Pseudomonadota bacterium]